MSALLDALKKAAEQKKEKQTVTLQPENSAIVEVATESKKPQSLSFNFAKDLEPFNELEVGTTPIHHKLDASVTLTIDSGNGLLSQQHATESDEVSSVSEAIPFSLEVIADDENTLPSHKAYLTPDTESVEFTPLFTEQISSSDLEEGSNADILADDTFNEIEESDIRVEPTRVILESEAAVIETESGGRLTMSDIEPKPEYSAPKKITESVDDDPFDWSLANIPAYQQQNHSEEQEASGRVLQGLASNKTVSSFKSSQWLLLGLLLLLFLTGLGFYLLDYYENSQANATQSLKRFELPAKSFTAMESHNENFIEQVDADNISKELALEEMPITKELDIIPEKVQQPQKAIVASKEIKKAIAPVKPEALALPAKSLVITSNEMLSKEQQAYQAYLQQDYPKAKGLYQEALKQTPRSLPSLFGLGAIAVHDGETQKAIDFYEMAERIDPNNAKVQSALTSLRSASGSYENWIDTIKSQILSNPKDANLYFSLGNLYVKRQDWFNAQENFFKALELAPNQMQYALNLAISLDHLGQYALAEKHYQSALALSSSAQPLKSESQVKSRVLAIQKFLMESGSGN